MKEIKNYEKSCEAIAAKFVKEYFEEPDAWWICDDIGGVFYVNDYYFNMEIMILALKYKATFDQLIDHYNMRLEMTMNEKAFEGRSLFSFENYLKYPKNFIIETKENGQMDFKII